MIDETERAFWERVNDDKEKWYATRAGDEYALSAGEYALSAFVEQDAIALCNRCGCVTGVHRSVLEANGATEVTCGTCAQTMTVDP